MNSLVDPDVIRALYRASQAKVRIDLLVRGICCLQPGVPGQSDNIRVISIVDRFLEHARIFFFEAGGKQEVYLSSADWMPRNFVRRIEVMFPVDDRALRDRIVQQILDTQLGDNTRARRLLSNGTYQRVRPSNDEVRLRSQEIFIGLARRRAEAIVRPTDPTDTPAGGTVIVLSKPTALVTGEPSVPAPRNSNPALVS